MSIKKEIALLVCLISLWMVALAFPQESKPVAATPPPAKEIQVAKETPGLVLGDDEFNKFFQIIKDRDFEEMKLSLIQSQIENLQLKLKDAQPAVDEKRKALSDTWTAICKVRNLDPGKFTLNTTTKTIIPLPAQR